MLKNILRLLAVFLIIYAGGIISQLWATEGVEKKVILQDKTVPAPGVSAPLDLGPSGCGCRRTTVTPKPTEEVKAPEKTEETEKEETATAEIDKGKKGGKPGEKEATAVKPTTVKPATRKPPVPPKDIFTPPAPGTVNIAGVRGYDVPAAAPILGQAPLVGQSGKDNLSQVFDNKQNVAVSDVDSKDKLLNAMTGSDIFYANMHATDPQSGKDHRLLVGKGQMVSAQELAEHRQKVGDSNMPKLIILNGCNTATNPAPGKTTMTLNQGLGIDSTTKGRAMLGYSTKVIGIQKEKEIQKVLSVWSKPGPQGNFPTLRQAVIKALGPNHDVVIFGDHNLRYSDLKK